MKRKNFYYITAGIFLTFLAGCATIDEAPVEGPAPSRTGIYHKVHRGETLWRIARAYEVPLEDIVRTNHIPNAATIEENQLVFIPGAAAVKEIVLDSEEINKREFIWPVQGKVVSYYGEARSVEFHRGIAIQGHAGEIVRASRSGEVIFADDLSGYGYTVIIDHKDGFCSVYSQNSSLLVKVGQEIPQSDPIAHLGKRGESAVLHFEIRRHGAADNPLYYLP